MGSEDFITLGDIKCRINKIDLDEFIRRIEELFSERAATFSLKPFGLYMIIPSLPDYLQTSFSSSYEAFVRSCHDYLLNAAKKLKIPLVTINLIEPRSMLEKIVVVCGILEQEKSTIVSLRKNIEYEDFVRLSIKIQERFRVVEELTAIFDSVVVYLPHLGLWASNNDLLTVFRSFIRRYVKDEKKVLVITVTTSKEEIDRLNLSHEKLGYIPEIFEINV
ncbi:MAG: hypothetical protein ACTSX9_02775 [Candidatus Njordarchaeales archaeon]